MKVFISSQNVPLGYEAPKFPGLYWISQISKAQYLYYAKDIWGFTVLWVMIFFVGTYGLVGLGSAANMMSHNSRVRYRPSSHVSSIAKLKPLIVAGMYLIIGTIQGIIVGSIIGAILAAIYRAGLLTMNTWIPFCWGLASILYHICSSYSTSSMLI